MAPQKQHVVRLEKRPAAKPIPGEDLVYQTAPMPTEEDLADGEVLVKNVYLTLDPAMRGWMRDQKSYVPPVKLGAVMRGSSVGQVLASRAKGLAKGDWVNCNIELGWCEYGIAKGSKLEKLENTEGVPPSVHLGALGGTGLTAYFGLIEVGQPKKGDTVVVSAAGGATGSMVCQIAKHIFGCRVVGIAGGAEKCQWLKDELGVDEAIDYKFEEGRQFKRDLRKACPKGVDVFFDNVGDWILNEVLKQINFKARVVLCGAIAGYNDTTLRPGPSAYLNLVSTSSRMEGFIVLNYADRFKEAKREIGQWLAEGKIKYQEEVIPGLSEAPRALLKLFGEYGGNRGRLIIDIHAGAQQTSKL
ncbi:Prostaglandin reductase 1 [Hondaea fermentalgiana]|uniref:Prostaglandin reductase 1 n=1 Tax=Hondaea fermentalgiana TaxID=2315210 RepID=A0A2R5G0X0_9STRA|nr:Prostaglandin reductase 1 [Hondaea fermentalgiana]|eukprot:GBG24650.1 Prostaglandin reductase 1 [Hondaea fermentalgiana]